MKYQDQYELVPNKFDPRTLQPFDKVLCRNGLDIWRCDFFSSYNENRVCFRSDKMDKYITIKEASIKWKLSVRRIQTLCNENRIPGAIKFGDLWAIPQEANKPQDERIKNGKYKNWRSN